MPWDAIVHLGRRLQEVIKQRDSKIVLIGNIVHDSVVISKDEVGGPSITCLLTGA